MSLVNSDTATGGTRRRRASARRRRGRLATGPRPLTRIAAAGSVVASPSSSPTAIPPFSLSLSLPLCLACVSPLCRCPCCVVSQVLIENPWARIAESLPDTVSRKRYGT